MNFLQLLYMFFYAFWAVVKVVQRAFAPPFWFGRDQRNTESRGMLQFVREVVIRIPSSQWFVGPAGIHKAPEADLAGAENGRNGG